MWVRKDEVRALRPRGMGRVHEEIATGASDGGLEGIDRGEEISQLRQRRGSQIQIDAMLMQSAGEFVV